MNKPQTLQGFRDFLPEEKRKRDWMMHKIIQVFARFGFEPLETPTLEYASLLLGKYGTEADKLVYTFKDKGDREVGLRYDQTVPTARILAQYQHELPRLFRRYQIQNVFRAERPQKGRYREFTQCDIDLFGSVDPLSDAEILACTYFAFQNVGFKNVVLKINDRKTLFSTLEPFASSSVSVFSLIQSIDKLDKQSEAEIIAELTKKGLPKELSQKALHAISKATMSDTLSTITGFATKLGVPEGSIAFTPALARGLDYYTGMIFEVSIPDAGSFSYGGGGRYDNLIEQLGGTAVPAVGIAFGFDRMVEAADTLHLFPTNKTETQILVTLFNASTIEAATRTASRLRAAGIQTELYVDTGDKLDKQLKYADKKGIPYVVIEGPDEVARNIVKLKNMQSKAQDELTIDQIIEKLTAN